MMVNADTAPALPWGASNEREDVQQVDARHSRGTDNLTIAEPAPDHNITPQLEEPCPSSGSTIEVAIGGRQQDRDSCKQSNARSGIDSYALRPKSTPYRACSGGKQRYQAFRDFEEETADVVFIADGRLYHSDSQDTLLRWRLEGDQQSDSEEEDEGNMVVDANDLNQHEELLERELGVSAEDVMRQQLQSYPPDQQRQLASGARDFVDHFRQHLSQLAQASGGSHTVTANDINGIFASLRQR